MYYQEKGNGQPFILLHGNGENSDYFIHQIEYFSSKYHIIAPDTRGHGKSKRGNTPFTLDQFVLDLHELITDLKLKNIILCGFSDGANIALLYTLKYPEHIDTLILNGGNLYPSGMKNHILLQVILKYWMYKIKQDQKNTELYHLMKNEPHIHPNELHAIQAYTLVIAGSKDMIKERHTKLIYKHIQNARLKIIRGDHFIAYKEYETFNHEIESFLKGESSC